MQQTNPCAEILLSLKNRRYRHKKRGTTYFVARTIISPDEYYEEGDCFTYMSALAFHQVFMQRSWSKQKGPLVLYVCEESHKIYARPYEEFMDGRFEDA